MRDEQVKGAAIWDPIQKEMKRLAESPFGIGLLQGEYY